MAEACAVCRVSCVSCVSLLLKACPLFVGEKGGFTLRWRPLKAEALETDVALETEHVQDESATAGMGTEAI